MEIIHVTNNALLLKDNTYIVDKPFTDLVISVDNDSHAKLVIKENITKLNIELQPSATLDLDFISNDNDSAIKIIQERSSTLNLNIISSEKMNQDIALSLNGEYAKANIKVLSVCLNDNTNINTKVYHNAKNTSSNVLNYGIALNNSNILFNTTGKIERGMSKSICKQLTRGVIIGHNSSVKALPILLIDEYDVKANHGATIGKMSDDELFYLMSRGLTKTEALKLILSGIINPFLDNLILSNFKSEIENNIYKKM